MKTANDLARAAMLDQRRRAAADARWRADAIREQQETLASNYAHLQEERESLDEAEATLAAIDQWLEQNGGPA